ncbi:hypothetical protein Bbelb_026240 [Branchiostoma belcheri]|nr:hypothetical protein Bbelb_026240 [Branchiostoma belcheri]
MADKQNQDLKGYVHNLSPMKKSKRTGFPYFNFDLQEKDSVKKVVCFSKDKRKRLEDHEQTQRGCKISRYSQGNLSTSDILINKATIINDTDLSFPSKNIELPITPLRDIDEIVTGEVIKIKVKIVSTNLAQTIAVKDKQSTSRDLTKTDVICADNTATRNLVVWEGITVLEDHSYILTVRVREHGNVKYINTMPDTTITEVDNIDTINTDDTTSSTITSPGSYTGKVCGISILSRFIKCINCKKKIQEFNETIVTCPACHMSMLTKNCPSDITAKLSIKQEEDAPNITVTCFKDTLTSLTDTSDPVSMTNEQLVQEILLKEGNYHFFCNIQNICTQIIST